MRALPLLDAGTAPVLAELDNAEDLAGPDAPGYGFGADVTPEKGSFRLGALLADLQVAANAGDADRTQRAARALLDGLVALEASDALVASATQLVVALANGAPPAAAAQLARPLLEPHVRAFVSAEGNGLYYDLGDWSETLTLVLAARAPDATDPVGMAKLAGSFAAALAADQAVPPGLADALATLAEVGATEAPTGRQIAAAKRALEVVNQLLG
jgi:hypothetical protein